MSIEGQLAQVLAELEMCSHVAAVNMDPGVRDAGEDIGGKRPPGGVDRKEDRHREPGLRTPERLLRSADHYRRELTARPWSAATILEEAVLSLDAWKHTPPLPRDEWPHRGDPLWRRWVEVSEYAPERIGAYYHLSRRYIAKIKADGLARVA